MRVYLYTLISGENERTLVQRPPYRLLANRARRYLDLLAWRLLGRFDFHFYNYEDRVNTNEGDIAIRLALHEQITAAFAPEPLEFVELAWPDLGESEVAKINESCDLFVIAGGYFHFSPAGDLKPPVPENAALFEKIRCPIVIYGAGANCRLKPGGALPEPLLSEASECMLRKLLAAVSLCAVRDESSRDLLRRYGARNVELVLDPAMMMNVAAAPNAQPAGIRIGLNFGFHGPHSEAILKKNFPQYIAFARSLGRRLGCRFYYFVHSEGEELVARLLRQAIDIEVIRGRAPELLARYREMTIQISHMMHSTILSLAAGTPAISLAYDIKNRALYELMGLAPYCLDALSLTAGGLEDAAVSLLRDRDAVARAVAERKAALAQQNWRFLDSAAVLARRYAARRGSFQMALNS